MLSLNEPLLQIGQRVNIISGAFSVHDISIGVLTRINSISCTMRIQCVPFYKGCICLQKTYFTPAKYKSLKGYRFNLLPNWPCMLQLPFSKM